MKIGVLGSGMVGNTLATKLVELGHEVMMGSRTADNEKAQAWRKSAGGLAKCGTFAEAAAFGSLVLNCTNGANSMAALRLVGAGPLRGKTLLDAANPLDFSSGAPQLTVCNTDSLGEQIQREFPETNVVKVFNTVNCQLMTDPSVVPGDHHLFICGNSAAAKADTIAKLGEWFGWKRENIIDLGDITAARCTEMYLPLWLRLMSVLGTPRFSIQVHQG
jgi:predicted dinucleotide-binding enzyme